MAYHRILLKGEDLSLRKEAVAGGTITPGDLIHWASGLLTRHAHAGQNAQPMFAIENSLQGEEIDDNYVTTDIVQYIVGGQGAEVFAFLALGENVLKGDALISNGDGSLAKFVAGSAGVVEYPDSIVAYAMEDLDLTTSLSVARGRLIVEVA